MTERRKLIFCIICYFLLAVTGLSAQTLQVIDTKGHTTRTQCGTDLELAAHNRQSA
jgi:hypothetical protein